MTQDPELARRVDEAGINALPAPQQLLLDGWLLRFAGGCTRRANSVNPLWPGADPAPRIPRAEALYAAQDLPCLFRLSSFQAEPLGPLLDTRGYAAAEGESRVLFNPDPQGAESPDVEISPRPSAEWLDAQARINGNTPRIAEGRRDMLALLAVPAAFGAIRREGPGSPIVSMGYLAIHDGIGCINMVVTDPTARRRGLSRRLMRHLLAWSRAAGAEAASLQVAADNEAALPLYQGLGFIEELYRYHYRRQAMAG